MTLTAIVSRPGRVRPALRFLAPSAILLAALGSTPALADPQGDPVHGKAVFAQCQICHSTEAGKNLIGPSLHHVVGRAAGSLPGFAYSQAMKKSGLTWTPETLSDFLTAPMKKVPGTRMGFAGLTKPKDRADVIAYLSHN